MHVFFDRKAHVRGVRLYVFFDKKEIPMRVVRYSIVRKTKRILYWIFEI